MIDKKKLKETYKNTVPPKGIFSIKNNKTGKTFLGGSLNLHGVLDKNKFLLEMDSHKNEALQKDWNAFGGDSFTFEILETLKLNSDPRYNYDEDLKILEMLWIEKFQPFAEKCYNRNENIRTV
jgi:hypothetical protein